MRIKLKTLTRMGSPLDSVSQTGILAPAPAPPPINGDGETLPVSAPRPVDIPIHIQAKHSYCFTHLLDINYYPRSNPTTLLPHDSYIK